MTWCRLAGFFPLVASPITPTTVRRRLIIIRLIFNVTPHKPTQSGFVIQGRSLGALERNGIPSPSTWSVLGSSGGHGCEFDNIWYCKRRIIEKSESTDLCDSLNEIFGDNESCILDFRRREAVLSSQCAKPISERQGSGRIIHHHSVYPSPSNSTHQSLHISGHRCRLQSIPTGCRPSEAFR